jgi:CHAT domain-containing protein
LLLEKIRAQNSDKHLRESLIKPYRHCFHRLSRLYFEQGNNAKSIEVLERIAAIGLSEYIAQPHASQMFTADIEADFVAEFNLPPIDEEELWSVTSESVPTAIVKYAFIGQDLYAFMALPNRPVGDWVVHSFDNFGYDELYKWYVEFPTNDSQLGGGWFGALHNFRGAIKGDVYQLDLPKDEFVREMLNDLIQTIEARLLELGSNIFAPIVDTLQKSGAKSILFVPIGILSQIPLQAMQWRDNINKHCVIDDYDVYCIPSLRVYSMAQKRPEFQSNCALIISDPGNDLQFARFECRAIAAFFPARFLLEGSEATLAKISDVSVHCGIAHFATHAIYSVSNANLSGICLATDPSLPADAKELFIDSRGIPALSPAHARYQLVTILQIFEQLNVRSGSLVFLSACDSGLPMPDPRGEDFVSLSASFLAAGAKSVICALWPVDSMVASLLTILFYSYFLSQDSVAALSNAQRRLRSLTAAEICHLWNSHISNDSEFRKLDLKVLSDVLGYSVKSTECPFDSAYYWASFGLWGCKLNPFSPNHRIL